MEKCLEQDCQKLWQQPVPSKVLQFGAANAAAYYVAVAMIEGFKQDESELEAFMSAVSAKASPSFKERMELREIPSYRAAAGHLAGLAQQLMAYASDAQSFFGITASYAREMFCLSIELQTPPGQKHVYVGPFASIPPSHGFWRSRTFSIATLKGLLLCEVNDALKVGDAVVQHAAARLGPEASQPLVRLLEKYVSYRESVMQQQL